MTLRAAAPQFSPDLPADVGHASIVREEALDWLGRSFPNHAKGDINPMAYDHEHNSNDDENTALFYEWQAKVFIDNYC